MGATVLRREKDTLYLFGCDTRYAGKNKEEREGKKERSRRLIDSGTKKEN